MATDQRQQEDRESAAELQFSVRQKHFISTKDGMYTITKAFVGGQPRYAAWVNRKPIKLGDNGHLGTETKLGAAIELCRQYHETQIDSGGQ